MAFLINHGYKDIYVIGHSMGGVLASYVASKYSEVKKLVLVAPAFRHYGFEDGTFSFVNSIVKGKKIIDQYGFKMVANRFLKLPSSYIFEFRKLVKDNEDTCKNVHIPTLILRGTIDEVVPEDSVELIYDQLDNSILLCYEDNNQFCHRHLVAAWFELFLKCLMKLFVIGF